VLLLEKIIYSDHWFVWLVVDWVLLLADRAIIADLLIVNLIEFLILQVQVNFMPISDPSRN